MKILQTKTGIFLAYNIHQIISIVFYISLLLMIFSRVLNFESRSIDYLFFFTLGADLFSYSVRWSWEILDNAMKNNNKYYWKLKNKK